MSEAYFCKTCKKYIIGYFCYTCNKSSIKSSLEGMFGTEVFNDIFNGDNNEDND